VIRSESFRMTLSADALSATCQFNDGLYRRVQSVALNFNTPAAVAQSKVLLAWSSNDALACQVTGSGVMQTAGANRVTWSRFLGQNFDGATLHAWSLGDVVLAPNDLLTVSAFDVEAGDALSDVWVVFIVTDTPSEIY
jgi:hypothetical protein